MTSYRTDGTVGPWAREKLDRLKAYLDPYTRILRSRRSWYEHVIYFDAFAGAGKAPLRKENTTTTDLPLLPNPSDAQHDDDYSEYVLGSPYIALSLEVPFTEYIFVEKDEHKASELEAFVEPFRKRSDIRVVVSDADTVIRHEINGANRNWRKTRGVFFLDPFGLQVGWDAIELLAKTKAIEVIVNLPVGTTIQRFLPKNAEVTESNRARLNKYFGDEGWYDVVYSSQQDLFGSIVAKNEDAGEKLARWYVDRMKRIFGHASAPRLIRNQNGGHLYYLVWAGPHPKGYEIAKYVLGPV